MPVVLGRLDVHSAMFLLLNEGLIYPQCCPRFATANGTEMPFYIDTSALVKLVVIESETAALRACLMKVDRDLVACDLVRTELIRAVRRGVPDRVLQARAVLDAITLVEVTAAVFEEAGRLQSTDLRSLDAIHVAAALDLGDDLEGLVTYDDRLARAAQANGIHIVAPT